MKKVSFSKKAIATVSIFTLLALGFFIFYVYPNFIFSKPLGDKLEYIGKTDYGCWLVCDANPGSTYYYATDMSVEEITDYFKATTSSPLRAFDGMTDFVLKTKDGHSISIYYYTDKEKVADKGINKKVRKKAIISIPGFQYDAAKNSL